MRYSAPEQENGPQWGWFSDNQVGPLDGTPFQPYLRGDLRYSIEDVRLHPPIEPGKIVCIGRNYAAHAAEHDVEVPNLPLLFLKSPSAIIGPGDPIHLPPQSQQVEHEGELAVVISKRGRWIELESAREHILGLTIANDVTARDLQRLDGQWTRAKGFDTFCPLGPWIETELDPSDLIITCSVNDQLRQMGSTRDMLFPVRQLITFISSVMTLEPGDLILTGTPSGVGPLVDGDQVTVDIENLGALTNPVRTAPEH